MTNIEDNGLLSFTTIGGIAAETLLGQRVEFLTRNGLVPGAISRKRIQPEQVRDRGAARASRPAHRHRRGRAAKRPRDSCASATPACGSGPPVELPNDRLLSKALDNRLGAYIALESARRIAEARDAQVDVVAVAAVQEEIGLYGARTAAFGLDPFVAIAIDVTPATDYPGGDPGGPAASSSAWAR